MNIAIASNDGINVAKHPGGCGGFVIFEIAQSTAVRVGYRSNASASSAEDDGVGQRFSSNLAQAYQSLVAALSDCSALVCQNMDDALVRALQGGALQAFICPESTVDESAQLFVQGHLRRLPGKACRADR